MIKRQNSHSDITLTEKLERQILYGLSLEYDHACQHLPPEMTLQIRKPLIKLNGSKRKYGSWHSERREITISRCLVLDHPWEAVREVMRHEMAHQVADELLHAAGESAHGPTFQKACQLLNANPSASQIYPFLSGNSPIESSPDHDRLLSRVQKLMALSSSENPHEAAGALAKANELILKFNLPRLESQRSSNYLSTFLGEPALRHYREDYLLANLLQDFYFIEGLWVTSYVLAKGKMGRVFEISGSFTNVKIGAYVYGCITQYIEKQWHHLTLGKKLGRYRKSDFAAGIVVGFHQKLERERFTASLFPKQNALILKGDPHLKVYMKERYPHTRSIGSSRSSMDMEFYARGIDKGKQLSLLKGVEANTSSKRYLGEK